MFTGEAPARKFTLSSHAKSFQSSRGQKIGYEHGDATADSAHWHSALDEPGLWARNVEFADIALTADVNTRLLDLVDNQVQGRNIIALDESVDPAGQTLTRFANTTNNTTLLQDFNSKELLVAPLNQESQQTLLTTSNGDAFLATDNQSLIAAETSNNGDIQLLSWQDASTQTQTITETVSSGSSGGRGGRGGRGRALTETITREITTEIEAGFYINSFSADGISLADSILLDATSQSTYDAEYLFGIDLNGDGHQGQLEGEFKIDLILTDTATNYHQYFFDAATIWENIITGDLTDITNTNGDVVIDDIAIDIVSFEENSNVLGWAGPSQVRWIDDQTLGLPTRGLMGLNTVHMDQMIQDNTLTGVIAHEIGHILGLGTLWQDYDVNDQFIDGPWNQYGNSSLVQNQFEYVGSNALKAYSEQTGNDEMFVPLENGDSAPGQGSVGSHWSETVLDSELMTPIANGDLTLSNITKGALADLGYKTTGQASLNAQLTSLQEAQSYIKSQNLATAGCSCNACCGLLGLSSLSSYVEDLSKADAISDTAALKVNHHINDTSIANLARGNMKHQPLEEDQTNHKSNSNSQAKTTHTDITSDITGIDFDEDFFGSEEKVLAVVTKNESLAEDYIISTNEAKEFSTISSTLAESSEAQAPLKNDLFPDATFNEITNVEAKFTKLSTATMTPNTLDQTNFLSTISIFDVTSTEEETKLIL